MTIMRSEQLKHGQQEKGFKNFHEKFDLNSTAQELKLQPDLQWEILENHYSGYSELSGRMEKHGYGLSLEAQQHEEEVQQTKTLEGSVDHLLILAQSAEVVAQSEDSVAGMHTNSQSIDQECSRELLNALSTVPHVSCQRFGICYEVTRTRLTQIRKQARCKHLILDQDRGEDNQCKYSQGKTIRLSQIKHQARCKNKNHLSPQEMITVPRNEQPQGRILRLSQMKHQARSKGNSTAKDRNEEHMDASLHSNKFKDHKEKVFARQSVKKDICQGGKKIEIAYGKRQENIQHSDLSVVEGVPAHSFFRGASQSSIVRWNDENLREHQRTARRLRAFKTKKLRQQLGMECIRNYNMRFYDMNDMKMSHIGLTSMTNSQLLSTSATLLKDKDLIACQQDPPITSGCTEKLSANFGVEKLHGHLGTNESSGLRCKSLQHIPKLQNNVLSFPRLPNHIFQECDTNMGWMLYMHHLQLKEYHQVVARQHRAECIKGKRALKDKQQNSKNSVLCKTASMKELYQATLEKDKDFQHLPNSLFHEANSGAQREFFPVKRLRLTQLRRDVRSGNQCSVTQGPAEN